MTDHPRLRRALRSLAARDVAGDPAAVASRATTIRRKRMAYAGAGAVSLAAFVGVAVAMATTAPGESGLVAQVPTESPAPTSAASPTATAPRSADPTVTSYPTPSHGPTPTSPRPGETYAPPGARVEVTVVPARTGEKTEITVRVTDTDGSWNGGTIDYGEGRVERIEFPPALCPARPSPEATDPSPYPGDATRTFTHAYRTGGPHTVRVTATTARSECVPGDAPAESVTDSATFEVPGTDLPANGPARPTVTIERVGGSGRTASVHVTARDPDGHLTVLAFDWGDLSGTTARPMPADCASSPDTGYPEGSADVTEDHTYPAPGTYTLTVTVRSAGCDGTVPQETTATLRLTVT